MQIYTWLTTDGSKIKGIDKTVTISMVEALAKLPPQSHRREGPLMRASSLHSSSRFVVLCEFPANPYVWLQFIRVRFGNGLCGKMRTRQELIRKLRFTSRLRYHTIWRLFPLVCRITLAVRIKTYFKTLFYTWLFVKIGGGVVLILTWSLRKVVTLIKYILTLNEYNITVLWK